MELPPLPPHLTLRTLQAGDFDKGFLQLLAQLTVVGDVPRATFEARLADIDANPDHTVFVVEDASASPPSIVGTAALLVEKKFIRGAAAAGHVEDVVVDSTVRGQKLGARLVAACAAEARAKGCYKVILDCSEDNVPFYQKCGLTRKEVQMVQYL